LKYFPPERSLSRCWSRKSKAYCENINSKSGCKRRLYNWSSSITLPRCSCFSQSFS